MILEILQVIYFMLPAYAAIISPVFARKINFLNYPVDIGMKIGKSRLFGKNKTFRGFFFGIISAILTALLQACLYPKGAFGNISILDYQNPILIGFVLGLGALSGDLAKSFFKRRLGIKEGKDWIPWDQVDYVIGTFAVCALIIRLPPVYWFINLIISPALHFVVVRIAILLRIR